MWETEKICIICVRGHCALGGQDSGQRTEDRDAKDHELKKTEGE